MPCHTAMIKDFKTLKPDQTIEEIFPILKKSPLGIMPVVDEKGVLLGQVSAHLLLRNLIPVSMDVQNGLQIENVKIGAAPGVAKRLKRLKVQTVRDVMERKVTAVTPDTPIWEGVNLLVHYGGPLLVIEDVTNKLVGMITNVSMLLDLEKMENSNE